MKKILFVALFMGFLFSLPTVSEANVDIQGTILSDDEYAQLIESLPEGAKLVPNEEFDAMNNQRALKGLYHPAHVSNLGWQQTASSKYIAGTTGKNLGLEAICLQMYNNNTSISYRAHVRNIGWQSWRSGGAIAGTTGRNLPIEAIQITTSGKYGVSYRAHVQDYGWLPYVSSAGSVMFGDYAGTTGKAKKNGSITDVFIYSNGLTNT